MACARSDAEILRDLRAVRGWLEVRHRSTDQLYLSALRVTRGEPDHTLTTPTPAPAPVGASLQSPRGNGALPPPQPATCAGTPRLFCATTMAVHRIATAAARRAVRTSKCGGDCAACRRRHSARGARLANTASAARRTHLDTSHDDSIAAAP